MIANFSVLFSDLALTVLLSHETLLCRKNMTGAVVYYHVAW